MLNQSDEENTLSFLRRNNLNCFEGKSTHCVQIFDWLGGHISCTFQSELPLAIFAAG